MKHLLSIKDLGRETIEDLFTRADHLLHDVVKKNRCLSALNGLVTANLFFEPSTRTQYSFSIAAQRLGAMVLNPVMDYTSTVKGESISDTVRSFIAMGSRLIVIRHSQEGLPAELANEIQDAACIINGGDGTHQHPTQTLLDLFTIRQKKGGFSYIKVVIIGDIIRSRVARSLVEGLHIMGCPRITLIAPPEFLPPDINAWPVESYSSIFEGIVDAEVVVTLRIQSERIISTPSQIQTAQFLEKFCLNSENLRLASPQAIVMHPGPINRGIEITSEIADGPQSVILQQITNGIAIRMAVIEKLLSLDKWPSPSS